MWEKEKEPAANQTWVWPVQNDHAITHVLTDFLFFFLPLTCAVCIRISTIARQTPHQWKGLRNDILDEYTAQHSFNVDWSGSLASSSGLQKSPVKDMVHAPIPPHYLLPLKGWQLHHSESKIWSHSWQPSADFFLFFFPLSAERRNSGILQTSQNLLYFPCCLCSLCCYPLKTQHDPPPPKPPPADTHTHTLLLFSIWNIHSGITWCFCLFFCPPAWFLLNARQIEHFRNRHFSGSVCQYRAPRAIES